MLQTSLGRYKKHESLFQKKKSGCVSYLSVLCTRGFVELLTLLAEEAREFFLARSASLRFEFFSRSFFSFFARFSFSFSSLDIRFIVCATILLTFFSESGARRINIAFTCMGND